MWTCPKCGREFKRANQGHYCGKAPETVAEYIGLQPLELHGRLEEMVDAIRSSVPDAKERIAWSMPVFEKEGRTVSLSVCKNHISFYTGTEAIELFKPELSEFVTKKSAIYFPHNKDLPLPLISDITKSCLADPLL